MQVNSKKEWLSERQAAKDQRERELAAAMALREEEALRARIEREKRRRQQAIGKKSKFALKDDDDTDEAGIILGTFGAIVIHFILRSLCFHLCQYLGSVATTSPGGPKVVSKSITTIYNMEAHDQPDIIIAIAANGLIISKPNPDAEAEENDSVRLCVFKLRLVTHAPS